MLEMDINLHISCNREVKKTVIKKGIWKSKSETTSRCQHSVWKQQRKLRKVWVWYTDSLKI